MRTFENSSVTFVLGVRRSGKSCIASILADQIRRRDEQNSIVTLSNVEAQSPEERTVDSILERFNKYYDPNKRIILIVDEIGASADWECAANHVLTFPNVKLIAFSSNRKVLSDMLDAYRNGCCEIVEMLPLSLEEFISFHGYREAGGAAGSVQNKRFKDDSGRTATAKDLYDLYIRSSAMPVGEHEPDDLIAYVSADGMLSSIIVHDILEVSAKAGSSAITDQSLLNCVIRVMAGSMGRNVSATWVCKQTPHYLDRPSSTKTVESYMKALVSSHLFYMVERFDIKAGQKLKTLPKYYIVDMSLYRLITGGMPEEEGVSLENRVYFELLRRGYEVFNGKYGDEEVDFMAVDGHDRVYVQTSGAFRERDRRILLSPLRKIKDNHPKVIIVNDSETRTTADGILILNALEFFMGAPIGRQR